MKRSCLCLAVVLAALAPLALAQETRPSKIDPAELVPADALVYLGVTDVGQAWDDFKKTSAYAVRNEADVGAALPESLRGLKAAPVDTAKIADQTGTLAERIYRVLTGDQ